MAWCLDARSGPRPCTLSPSLAAPLQRPAGRIVGSPPSSRGGDPAPRRPVSTVPPYDASCGAPGATTTHREDFGALDRQSLVDSIAGRVSKSQREDHSATYDLHLYGKRARQKEEEDLLKSSWTIGLDYETPELLRVRSRARGGAEEGARATPGPERRAPRAPERERRGEAGDGGGPRPPQEAHRRCESARARVDAAALLADTAASAHAVAQREVARRTAFERVKRGHRARSILPVRDRPEIIADLQNRQAEHDLRQAWMAQMAQREAERQREVASGRVFYAKMAEEAVALQSREAAQAEMHRAIKAQSREALQRQLEEERARRQREREANAAGFWRASLIVEDPPEVVAQRKAAACTREREACLAGEEMQRETQAQRSAGEASERLEALEDWKASLKKHTEQRHTERRGVVQRQFALSAREVHAPALEKPRDAGGAGQPPWHDMTGRDARQAEVERKALEMNAVNAALLDARRDAQRSAKEEAMYERRETEAAAARLRERRRSECAARRAAAQHCAAELRAQVAETAVRRAAEAAAMAGGEWQHDPGAEPRLRFDRVEAPQRSARGAFRRARRRPASSAR